MVCVSQTFRLRNPAIIIDRSLRLKVSQTELALLKLIRNCFSMRLIKELTLSYFLKALDFFFIDSGGLLPNSIALVKTLLIG
jgi:hypothetical protein